MASEAMCRGFKSLQARQSGPLAQLVEQLTLNQRVVGSIPTRPTTLFFIPIDGWIYPFRPAPQCDEQRGTYS